MAAEEKNVKTEENKNEETLKTPEGNTVTVVEAKKPLGQRIKDRYSGFKSKHPKLVNGVKTTIKVGAGFGLGVLTMALGEKYKNSNNESTCFTEDDDIPADFEVIDLDQVTTDETESN